MSNYDFNARGLIERFRAHSTILAIQSRYVFEAALLVETAATIDFYKAKIYSQSPHMRGRVRPQRTRQGYIWYFELEEDAFQFALKFAQTGPRRLP